MCSVCYNGYIDLLFTGGDMKVKCIDSSYSHRLTSGNEYKVLSERELLGDSYYQVISDDNSVGEFLASRFEIVKEDN